MKEYVLKKYKQGIIMGIIGVLFLIGFLALSIIGAATDSKTLIGAGLGCMVACVPLLVLFFELYKPMISSHNYLKKHNLIEAIEDINPTAFALPRSKISIGKTAFFSKKSKVVIPYTMVLWVYNQEVYTNGIKSYERILIGCRDRKWFNITVENQELPQLLNLIAKYSPDLILGYGNEQNRQYYEITKKFRQESRQ